MAYRRQPISTATTSPSYPYSNAAAQHHSQQSSLSGQNSSIQDDPAAASSPTMRKRQRTDLNLANPGIVDPQQQLPPPGAQQQQQPLQPVQSSGVPEDGFIHDQDAVESGGDDDDEEEKPKDKKAGRRKIKIEFIQDKSRRHITFSKRKAGTRSTSLYPLVYFFCSNCMLFTFAGIMKKVYADFITSSLITEKYNINSRLMNSLP